MEVGDVKNAVLIIITKIRRCNMTSTINSPSSGHGSGYGNGYG
jgi:hypothetical protein